MEIKEFGEYFADLRRREGYKSQRDLAEKSGVSNATISRIESGTNRVTPEILRELASWFISVSYEELMQKAGYLDLETVVNEVTLDNQIYEIQQKLDLIGSKISLANIFTKHKKLERFFEAKQISIDTISVNINVPPLDVLAMLESRSPISFDTALKLTRLYRFSFAKMFKIRKAFVLLNLKYDEDEILENIDELLHQEYALNVEKIGREVAASSEDNSLKIPDNISSDEIEYLIEQLNVYRKLKLKNFNKMNS